jgi:hypothetical protein
MKRIIVIILLIVALVCSCLWVYAQGDNAQSSDSAQVQNSSDLPELNPSPEPGAIDPSLVKQIDIELTDGRVFHFNVPVEQFDNATISHLIGFIRTSDADSTTFTLYN